MQLTSEEAGPGLSEGHEALVAVLLVVLEDEEGAESPLPYAHTPLQGFEQRVRHVRVGPGRQNREGRSE